MVALALSHLFRLRWWLPPLAVALVVVAHAEWMPLLTPHLPVLERHAAQIEQFAPHALRSLYLLVPLTLLAALWPGRAPHARARRPVASLSAQELQDRLVEAFRVQGFGVHVRSIESDGADLLVVRNGERMLVQCRHWRRRQVDTEQLRALCGLIGREKAGGAVLLTRGRLSVEAIRFARDVPIVVMDEEELEELLGAKPDALRRVNATLGQRTFASTAV